MSVRIRVGFANITHEICFNPNVVTNGEALALEHVIRVEELRNEKVSGLIKGSVIRQASVNSTPYKVELHLSDKRLVTQASCTCASSAAAKCKHIYAVIHYVNTNRSLSKTSLEQEWGKPTDKQLGHEMYSKPMTITELFGQSTAKNNSQSPAVVELDVNLNDLPHACALRSVLKQYNISDSERLVRKIISDCIYSATNQSDNMDCEACILNLLNFCEGYPVHESKLSYGAASRELQIFYEREILLSDEEIIELCIATRCQSNSSKWLAARSVRISGSSRAHAIKIRHTKTVEALVEQFLQPVDLKGTAKKNTQYGLKHEWTALKEYQKNYDVKVVQIGVVVSKSQPWLCASPDGIVIEDNVITKLVEIKCPISCTKMPVVDTTSSQAHVSYLNLSNGNIELKESHVYYTQCQVQMYVTGLSLCDLFVWSPKGSCVVPVHRDESFLKSLILKLETFYFKHFLKALADTSKENVDNNNTNHM